MATGFPVRPVPRFDSTKKVALMSTTVIYEHDFSDPLTRHDGWAHLWTPGEQSNCGSTQWSSRGGGHLAVIAETQVGGLAMALRRLGTYFGDGRHQVEMFVSIERMNYSHNYPRYYIFGLDVATEDGSLRNFFQLRYLQYNEAGSAVAEKWQLDMGGGNVVDIPGGAIPLPENENKALPIRLILDVDTATGRYHGVQIGEVLKLGSLAPVPDQSIYNLGARAPEALPSFARGANLCVGVANRTSGSKTKGKVNMHFCRLTKMEYA